MHQAHNQKDYIIDKLVQEVLDLGKKEGMLPQIGDFHHIIAGVYAGMGDNKTAKRHAEQAVERLRHYAGFDNDRTLKAADFLQGLT